MINLSIIAPYFEENLLVSTINEWIKYLDSFDEIDDFEILLYNDGSSSEFNSLINKDLLNLDKRVIIFHSITNNGPGCGYIKLIDLVQKEYTLITDSDGQFLINSLNKETLEKLKHHDCILFFRDNKRDTLISKFGARISNYFCNKIFQTKIKDFSCAFKIIKTVDLKKMKFSAKFMNYSIDHTSQILLKNITYCEQICYTSMSNFKKRSFKKEIKRASKRFLYILYLYLQILLIKKNILSND
jgi:glycosyltransferase involved in cell wall biosynthesis